MQSLLRLSLSGLLLVVSGVGSRALAVDEFARFVNDVQPLLEARCVSCHGPEKQEGGLRLDSMAAAKAGGDRGAALVPGNVEKSLLITAITFDDSDLQMPPKQKLSNKEIAILTQWVKAGAAWPEPVVVLFDDDPAFLKTLNSGKGKLRLVQGDVYSGRTALAVTPPQRFSERIPGWHFVIREKPQPGQYRYLRLAWKKRGGGSVMIELASSGQWPSAKVARGRYVAGPNTTGWSSVSISDTAPTEWTVSTFDLWKDLGDFTLTGIAPTCDGGEEAFFDAMILGPDLASLDAYRPGAGSPGVPDRGGEPIGDAFTDARNPIRKLYRGKRLDLWSLKSPVASAAFTHGDSPMDAAIDALIQEGLDAAGLKLSPKADQRTLIRRLTFDLTGLPPTLHEVAAFVADKSADAYGKLVKRLLESPHYGERQARLWLDVVRYADTHGYERDEFRPLIWQYRDYVIRAFNQDKPFDQFIREQLAGDELVSGPPQNPSEADALIATGFLRLGQWDSTASIFQEADRLRAEMMADVTNTTASAFLGLTVSCCQCHDHKYDPLSQADHYRLRAFFAGVTPRDELVIELPEALDEINRHNAELDGQVKTLKAEQSKLNKDAEPDKGRYAEIAGRIAAVEATKRKPRAAMGAGDSGATVPVTHVFYQGDFHSPRDAVPPGFVSVLYPGPANVEAPRGNTTGRRLALANWIASASNPWTARVIVNRIWQQHFGTGLIATPNDLGYTGSRPTHPELLDGLAVAFVENGWSLKRLHRAIVMSKTYRQSSSTIADSARVDPDNHLLWRQNIRRLDAETLRDSLLLVSGSLKPYAGGKSLWPEVPKDLLRAQPAILEALEGKDGGRMQGWYTDPVEETDVRSVFLIRKRCLPIPFLQAFDLPDTTVSCARRDTTVVAAQALMLLNSTAAVRFAHAFAARIAGPADNLSYRDDIKTAKLVRAVFQHALARNPDNDELQLARALLTRHTKIHQSGRAADRAEQLALVDLCRAIFNLNEFVYVD